MKIDILSKQNIETAVLSYIIQKKDSFEDLLFFPDEVFKTNVYREIYSFLKKEYLEKDAFSLSKFLITKNIDDQTVYSLYNSVITLPFEEIKEAFIEYSKERIIENFLKDAEKTKEKIKREELLKVANEKIEEIDNLIIKEKNADFCIDIYKEHLEEREKQINEYSISGISSGISRLDEIIMGLKDGEYILVAARPSMGKTSLATQFFISALESDREGVNVLISLEMPIEQILGRIIAQKSDILSLKETIHGHIETQEHKEEIKRILSELKNYNFIIEDYSDLKNNRTIEKLESQLKKIEKKYGKINFIEIDYVQLIDTEKFFNSQRDKITYISNKLQQFSKMFKCPVVVLSQLNRELEKRIDKRPILSDLRDSGSLEQDADIVIFLYRKEVYLEAELKEKIQKGKGDITVFQAELERIKNSEYTSAELIVRKNRNGPIGTAECYFLKKNTKFVDVLPSSVGVKEITINEIDDPEIKKILYKEKEEDVKEFVEKNAIDEDRFIEEFDIDIPPV